MDILLKNAEIVAPHEVISKGSLLIQNRLIAEISAENQDFKADQIYDLTNLTVYAGFIDIHNHGAVGVDVNTATLDDLRKLAHFLARNGVTAWLPTLVPDADENYAKVIENLDRLMRGQENQPFAQTLGVHYEGVFANRQMCGALRTEFFKNFTGGEIETLPKLKSGKAVHLTTLAPEIENGIRLIRELVERKWVVSIGHTNSGAATLDAACKAGAKHLTHFFNAMTGLHHREIGVAGWGLTNDLVSFDIIADGVHVDRQMLKFACRAKADDKVLLISDSVAPTGLGDGEFELWNEKISVAGGKTRNSRGGIAGSVITLLDAVKTMRSLGFSPVQISRMTGANPARLLGINAERGSIEPGKIADLAVLDESGNVRLSFVGGKICGNKKSDG